VRGAGPPGASRSSIHLPRSCAAEYPADAEHHKIE
jgi:hypothetical protein